MIHKIKGLYDQGNGMSIRAISQELSISRNTVRKYLQMPETQISHYQNDRSRTKRLDEHRDFLIHQLQRYPKLSAVKLARRLQERLGELEVSSRSIRRYVQALKEQVATGQLRYFGGVTEECVYDQTKLVVINEQYRELTLNQRFHEYATTACFNIHACEGYDPESKGKVEAGVKYVKQDCLYGEEFDSEQHLRQHVAPLCQTSWNLYRC